ncbi:MAG: RHS repeat-associated core domain-containing protein [Clostridia bacterium]|nr:RHS repeat-associated core domain-containing protein [Clostridia bacterium]
MSCSAGIKTRESSLHGLHDYDSVGNKSSVTSKSDGTSGATAAAYSYLPNHYRMSKTVDGVVTQQIWDGNNIVAEANSANAILRSYTRGHQLLTDDDRRAYMYDGHGNLVQQNRGTAAENVTRYDAYGNKIEKSGTANDTPFGYCGEYLDKESGLIYLRNRYYDSESGRFISEDPIKDGSNWYSYCSGNPIRFIDKNGMFGENTVLAKGSNNSMRDVIALQQVLSQKKLLDARYTYGVYDEYTMQAVNLYKEQNNLTNTGDCYGRVGKTTWEHMGLDIDSKYEISHSTVGTNGASSDGLFASLTGPNISNGLNFLSADAGLAEIKKEEKYYELNMSIATANADIGITTDYIGIDVSAELYSGGAGIKIPIPFTDSKLAITGTGYVGGVGIATKLDIENKKVVVKVIDIIGTGIEVGIE